MPTYTQADRALSIKTPLGKDVLLLTGFRGHETISQLFRFHLDLLAEADSDVRFDRIVGQNVTIEMPLASEEKRYFSGLVKTFSQGARDRLTQDGFDGTFVHFRAELVPKLWLLTKKIRSRIFQHVTVPDILRQVFSGFDVAFEISGAYFPRDYCVQYRESDFDFASRLMEEEGIYYFFRHADSSHQMVVVDAPNQHPFLPDPSSVLYGEVSAGVREDMRVTSWEKTQELRSNEYTLWDHCFELPGNHLEAEEKIIESVPVGKATHKLTPGNGEKLEIYDYPGGYAQRFDGVDRNGAPRPQDLRGIFEDRQRTVRIRMQQEETATLGIRGAGDCGHFTAGYKFTLKRHFDADDQYLLTSVEHHAHLGGFGNSSGPEFSYENRFTCIPAALPYRPQRATRKPVIAGVQTATVVGPPGEELFCDKYGRVKVQFHWDREGKKDSNSSCWLRVAQVWAGSGWGAFFWPRIGNEVVVVFEEGDPDQPLIIGSLYNAENMPPFPLPAKNNLTGFKSATVRGKAYKNFNGVVFDDTNGHEHLALHSERHMSFNSEFDKVFHAGRHKGERVSGASTFTVGTLPGGGGSGGGSNPAWPKPYPQGVLGLNAAMVYGENVQAVVGTNHQLALGNNFQICINPVGLMCCSSTLPEVPFFTEALSSGVGGNMQLTIGTNAQLVYGQNIEVDAGMPKLELHRGSETENALSYGIVAVIGALTVLYALAYGLLDKDWKRAATTITFQGCLDILLAILMMIELETKQMPSKDDPELDPFSNKVNQAMDRLRENDRQTLMDHAKHINWTMEDMGEFMGSPMRISPSATEFFGALSVVLGAAVLPLVLVADHEKDPEDAQKQQQQQQCPPPCPPNK